MGVATSPRNFLELTLPDGTVLNFPSFTCVHCQRVCIGNPGFDPELVQKLEALAASRGLSGIDLATVFGWEPSRTCLKCNALTCCEPGCANDCRSTYEQDGPLAARDVMSQPWMLRDEQSYPVDRLYLPNGETRLVRRKDNGMTQRELERQAIPPSELHEYANRVLDERAEEAWEKHRVRVAR